MANHSTTISFEHGKGNEPSALDDGDLCEDEIEVEMEWEPGESNYGADADGNRGISVPGYMTAITNAPEKCEECGHIYDDDEKKAIEKLMNDAADEYEPDFDPPEPDDYPDFGDGMPY